jgi:hypothetical protein
LYKSSALGSRLIEAQELFNDVESIAIITWASFASVKPDYPILSGMSFPLIYYRYAVGVLALIHGSMIARGLICVFAILKCGNCSSGLNALLPRTLAPCFHFAVSGAPVHILTRATHAPSP